jgi:hypothetical protein
MKITTVGIDLAKSVFHLHGVDERGKAVLRKHARPLLALAQQCWTVHSGKAKTGVRSG